MQINDKAILVRLAIGMPGNSRKDKALTAETIQRHALASNAGKWGKMLYPAEAFEPITKLAGLARTFHYENTLPWLDDGQRILPTLNYQDYMKEMRQFKAQFVSLADSHFIAKLADWEAKAKAMHNGTYRNEDYKPAHKLAKKFRLETDCQPIPTGDDFRVKFSDAEMSALKSDMNARLQQAAQSAEDDLWLRLSEPLAHLSAKLADPSAHFKDSIIGNLKDICQLIPKLNLTANAKLQSFANEVQARLVPVSADTLRTSPSDRNAARLTADSILAKMSAYLPEVPNE